MFSSFSEDAGRSERPFELSAEARHVPGRTARLQQVLAKVAAARRPILIGGHGVWWSGAEKGLEEAGRKLGIPVYNVPYHQKLLGEQSEAYMGLADIHQYHPSKDAFGEADLVLMVGGRLDNQMNFGNPPLFPRSAELVCVNGSHEEVTSTVRRCDAGSGAFFDALVSLGDAARAGRDGDWFDLNRRRRVEWVAKMHADVDAEAATPEFGGRIHPLHLALDVQDAMQDDDWLVIDGGNTHFWSEIAVNMAGSGGRKLGASFIPGPSACSVGVSFALSAKNLNRTGTWC